MPFSLTLLRAALEGLHQVDDRGLAGLFDGGDLLAFLLFLYQALDILTVFIREILRLERSLQVVNQALRQLKLLGGVLDFGASLLLDLCSSSG
jgi:hypothetical protein